MVLDTTELDVLPETALPLRQRFFRTLITFENAAGLPIACAKAEKTLQEMFEDKNAPALHIRSLFWLWHCAKTRKLQAEQDHFRALLWERYPLDYHTLRAFQEDGDPRAHEAATKLQDNDIYFRSATKSDINMLVAGIEALHRLLKGDGAAAVIAHRIGAQVSDAEPEFRLYFGGLMARVGAMIPSVLPASRALAPVLISHPEYLNRFTLRALFPQNYIENVGDQEDTASIVNRAKLDVDAHLILAMIHHESAFYPRAVTKYAYGLMQLEIPTAMDQYKKLQPQAPVLTADQLFDPDLNVQLGVLDFQQRLKDFSGNKILTLAAYNAGARRIQDWMKKVPPLKDADLQLDLLMMNEDNEFHTSQYVSQILGKQLWYDELYP